MGIALIAAAGLIVFFGPIEERLSLLPQTTSEEELIPEEGYVPEAPELSDESGISLSPSVAAAAIKKVATAAKAVPSSAYPARIHIPSIGVNANVQAVGLTKAGNIAAPQGFSDAAWYKYGAVPGAIGSAIIDGHVDNGLFRSGVFKRLDDVAVGDTVTVTTRGGKKLEYAVSRIEVYNYKQVPMKDIVTESAKSQLVLITCAGTWIPAEKTYDQRLIVYATLK